VFNISKRQSVLTFVIISVFVFSIFSLGIKNNNPAFNSEQTDSAGKNWWPSDNEEMPIMELEEYLGQLRYYGGGLTGKLSSSLSDALNVFKKDIKSTSPSWFFSTADRFQLRQRYWLSVGKWYVPPPFFFYSDNKKVVAYGVWQHEKFLPNSHPSKIVCSIADKICIEVIQITAQSNAVGDPEADLWPVRGELGFDHFLYDAIFQRYRITEYDQEKIKAVSIDDGDFLSLPETIRLRWSVAWLAKRELDINIKSHTIMSIEPNRENEKKIMRLVDSGDLAIRRRYSDLSNRYYINDRFMANRKRLFKWMEERDVAEYAPQKNKIDSAIMHNNQQIAEDFWLPLYLK
jgi:hypothetical protein